ncbi:hypothetical protein ACF052_31355 [Streptomyces pilosus]|uniref:hypothetical protein n=1 Tax=Streptomyces pilosus TaxID=28893 RepID=UPI00370056C9
MDEQQATQRAEEVIHEAVDEMSPQPVLKRTGLRPVGPCLADEHSTGERVQVRITYQLTEVPGHVAKSLVRQARDAWVNRGYDFQSADADWSDAFPAVHMRTVPDDFWMTALTGVVDRAAGDGLAAISVTSPCFAAKEAASADPAALRTAADTQAERSTLEHSSRLYDALRVPASPTGQDEGIGTYRNSGDTYAHHAWSTLPLTEEELVRAMTRAQVFLQTTGWGVRHVPSRGVTPAIIARHPEDGCVARLFPSADGIVRIAVATSSAAEDSASA